MEHAGRGHSAEPGARGPANRIMINVLLRLKRIGGSIKVQPSVYLQLTELGGTNRELNHQKTIIDRHLRNKKS